MALICIYLSKLGCILFIRSIITPVYFRWMKTNVSVSFCIIFKTNQNLVNWYVFQSSWYYEHNVRWNKYNQFVTFEPLLVCKLRKVNRNGTFSSSLRVDFVNIMLFLIYTHETLTRWSLYWNIYFIAILYRIETWIAYLKF